MHKETLSYCTVKSINLSERSPGLLVGINYTERQIKIQGTGWQSKSFLLSPCLCLLTESLKLPTSVPVPPKNTFQGDVFHRDIALAHTVNQGVIFPFSVWELWFFFPGGYASCLWTISVCFHDISLIKVKFNLVLFVLPRTQLSSNLISEIILFPMGCCWDACWCKDCEIYQQLLAKSLFYIKSSFPTFPQLINTYRVKVTVCRTKWFCVFAEIPFCTLFWMGSIFSDVWFIPLQTDNTINPHFHIIAIIIMPFWKVLIQTWRGGALSYL